MSIQNIRIVSTNATPLDASTPLDQADLDAAVVADDGTIVITTANPFGLFDPGEVTNQRNQNFILANVTVISEGAATLPPGSAVGLQSPDPEPAGTGNIRQIIDLNVATSSSGIVPTSNEVVPTDHKLAFLGSTPGPHVIQLTLVPVPEDYIEHQASSGDGDGDGDGDCCPCVVTDFAPEEENEEDTTYVQHGPTHVHTITEDGRYHAHGSLELREAGGFILLSRVSSLLEAQIDGGGWVEVSQDSKTDALVHKRSQHDAVLDLTTGQVLELRLMYKPDDAGLSAFAQRSLIKSEKCGETTSPACPTVDNITVDTGGGPVPWDIGDAPIAVGAGATVTVVLELSGDLPSPVLTSDTPPGTAVYTPSAGPVLANITWTYTAPAGPAPVDADYSGCEYDLGVVTLGAA